MGEQRIEQTIYIKAPIEQVWDALTNPDVTEQYWGKTRIESDWKPHSTIRYVRDGQTMDEHVILEIQAPAKLVHTFQPLFGDFQHEAPSKVSITLQSGGEVVRLALLHDHFAPESKVYAACREGWPMILSALKTLLETGGPLPEFQST
ncbi:SRPBCC family protein [Massilia horti]|nr:SRPBCC family protein [Massilia horti]